MPATEPTREELNRVLLWVLEDPARAKVPLVKNLRGATNSGLKVALDVVNNLIHDVDNITSPWLLEKRKGDTYIDPDDIDAQRELADLDEMERTWMRE